MEEVEGSGGPDEVDRVVLRCPQDGPVGGRREGGWPVWPGPHVLLYPLSYVRWVGHSRRADGQLRGSLNPVP